MIKNNTGIITQVTGAVVDVHFETLNCPFVYNAMGKPICMSLYSQYELDASAVVFEYDLEPI